MMVSLEMSVECVAKIAMTALRCRPGAMGLLRRSCPDAMHFSSRQRCIIRSSKNRQTNSIRIYVRIIAPPIGALMVEGK
jgi:hypothetical protein